MGFTQISFPIVGLDDFYLQLALHKKTGGWVSEGVLQGQGYHNSMLGKAFLSSMPPFPPEIRILPPKTWAFLQAV